MTRRGPARALCLVLILVALHAADVAPAGGQQGQLAVLYPVHSGKVMDVPAASRAPGTQIVQWRWNAGVNQLWRAVGLAVIQSEAGTVTFAAFFSAASGMALDVPGGSTADGAPVIQWPWNGGPNQIWLVVPFGPQLFVLVNWATGKVLQVAGASTADGAPLVQSGWTGGAHQIWGTVLLS